MSREKILQKKLLNEPDEFHTLSQRVWIWVNEHRDRAGMIAGGITAAVLIGVGVKAYVERSKEQRSTAVAAAVARFTQAPPGAVAAELQHELAGLADRYAASPEGALAKFFHAGALARAGETDKARQIYAALTSQGQTGDNVAVLSRVALAYLDLTRGAEGALPAFEELLKVQGTAVPRAQIMLEIAGIHQKQGRAAEARRVYQDLLAEHPEGSWATQAKERLSLLPGESSAS